MADINCNCFALALLLLLCSCAAAAPPTDGRIVGGSDQAIYNAPWQVSIQISARHECGGAIYSSEIIITAAHCLANRSASLIQVRAGSNQHNSGGSLIPVAAYLLHEQYNPQRYHYDIAVLRLAQRLTFGLSVKSINLASSSPAHDTKAVATGWGYTEEGGASGFASRLQSVQLRIIGRGACASSQYGYGWDFVTEEMICAAATGADACKGDSGGPLVAGALLVGIVSWGYGCAQANYPGVYADVAVLRLWIGKAANMV